MSLKYSHCLFDLPIHRQVNQAYQYMQMLDVLGGLTFPGDK